MLREDPLADRPAFDEMLLDEPWDAIRRHAVVPGAFRIHDQDRPLRADAQTLHLRPVAFVRATAHAQVLVFEQRLENGPRGQSGFGCAAVGADAEKDVAAEVAA